MPATHFVRTVLPAPWSPTSAVTWPDGRSRSTWYRAWTGPKCLSSSRILSSGSPVAVVDATAAISPCIIGELEKERRRHEVRRRRWLPLRNSGRGVGGGAGLPAQRRCVGGRVLCASLG